MSHRTQTRSKNQTRPRAAPLSKQNAGGTKARKIKNNKEETISPANMDKQDSESSTVQNGTTCEALDCVLITTRNDAQKMNLAQAEARLKVAATNAKAAANNAIVHPAHTAGSPAPMPANAPPTNASSNEDKLPERVDLMSIGDFTDDDLEAINYSLQGDQGYRFSYPEGGYRQYHGFLPEEGPRSPADDRTLMFDNDSSTWVPIPPGFTAPHVIEDYIEAVNDVRKLSRNCSSYVHPEAKRAFQELNNSRGRDDPELKLVCVNYLSLDEEKGLQAGLNEEGAVYKFKKPWEEGHVRYHGHLPREGRQNAADKLTEIWDETKNKYVGIPDDHTVPHDPQDYVDAVNWEIVHTEEIRRAEVAQAARRAQVNYDEWDAPDPMIESDLSGSDWEETRREKRALAKSSGKPVSDTDEEDEEEEREMQHELQEEAHSSAAVPVVTIKRSDSDLEMGLRGGPPTSSDACWEALRASFTPAQKDAACILRSYGLTLMPDALLTEADEISSKKLSLLESAMYPMLGNIVWQLAGRIGNLYGRTAQFAMERAGLFQKEKRAPNRYNLYKSFASQSKPEDGNKEGLLLWNKTNNEEYRKLMDGATTKEEKDERIKDAVKFLQEQVTDEGTNVRDASLRFADNLKAITDLITNIKRRDRSFDFAGIMVYSGQNATARNKSGFFMSSSELQDLCKREQWPIAMLTDVFVSKVRAMHADRIIRDQVIQHGMASSATPSVVTKRSTAGPSTASPPSARLSTAGPSTAQVAKASIITVAADEKILPNAKDRQRQFSDLFLNLLNSYLPQKELRKSVPWTTWPNLAYQFQLVITGWDSTMLDVGFCRSFVSTKIQNRQWMHFSLLVIKGILQIKSWNADQKQIAEADARFGEIPVILNQQGLPMVFVKDSNKWVRGNCLISTTVNKQQHNGTPSSPASISSPPPSPGPSKKRLRDDAMSLPDEREDARSVRDYRPIPKHKQAQEEPEAKRQRRVSFVGLSDNMFYKKYRQATQPVQPVSFYNPLRNQSTSSSSRSDPTSQQSVSQSAQPGSSRSQKHVGAGKKN